MLIYYIFKNEWNFQYKSRFYLLSQLFSVLLTLLTYYFTSKAIEVSMGSSSLWMGYSYFQYILMGEIFISLPIAASMAFTHSLKQLAGQNLLLDVFIKSRRPLIAFYKFSLGSWLRPLIDLLFTFTVALVLFQLIWPLQHIFFNILLLIVFLPLFMILGCCSTLIVFIFGRGHGLIHQLQFVASLFAGTYFPLNVLPESIVWFLKNILPHGFYLQLQREIALNGTITTEPIHIIVFWMIFIILFMILQGFLFKKALQRIQNKGLPDLYRI